MIDVNEALGSIGKRAVRDDSRAVREGDVLVWDSRIGGDSAKIMADARTRGATLVISDAESADAVVENAGAVLSAYAALAWPRQPEVMLGVTGTSGKTSVAWFGRQLAGLCGYTSASVGTLGVMRSDDDMDEDYTGFTSPTALKLHPILDTLAGEGVSHCLLEISSHALALNRCDGVKLKAAGLTNITQDHLDFHGTHEAYAAAKMRLFSEVLPDDGVAVINVGRSEAWPAASVAKQRGLPVLTVGTRNAELVCEVRQADARGLEMALKFDAVPDVVRVPLIGAFQAENLAVALGLLVAGGVAWQDLRSKVAKVGCVPGRMEVVPGHAGQPAVVVDYAHKPDALERALQSLRPLVKDGGKLRVVFGCGGNRDALKRPIMGKIASDLADVVYVTDDNPRREDATAIRKQVLDGATGQAEVRDAGGRREAIASALSDAAADDVVLVAGKGHESGQIIGDEVLPFDDRVMVRELLG